MNKLPSYDGDTLSTWDEFEKATGIRLDRGPTTIALRLALEAAEIVNAMLPESRAFYMARLRELARRPS